VKNIIFICLFCSLVLACEDQDFIQYTVSENTSKGEVESGGLAPDDSISTNAAKDELAGLQAAGLVKRSTGDLDELAERRLIRVLTVYGLGRYWLG